MMYFYPERYVATPDLAIVKQVTDQAQARLGAWLAQLDDELARVKSRSKGTQDLDDTSWFLGSRFSVVDAYVFTLCRWTRNFSTQPARTYPHLGPYLRRMAERPSVQRVFATELLQPPLY
jgi:glutathione S-transferase